jgi:hypothetical protein
MEHDNKIDRTLSRLMNDPLSIVSILFLYTVFINIRFIAVPLFQNTFIKNPFFPEYFTALKMGFPYLFLGVLVFIRSKIAYFIGVLISFFLMIHPIIFAKADIVITFYLFLWLFVKGKNHSIFLGRLLISFIFFGAAVGKLTPEWMSGEQLNTIVHLRKIPSVSLVIIGEFLVAISFLLPFYIASLISIFILIGTTMSMHNGTVIMATLPILGMILTFLSIVSLKKSELRLYFHEDEKKSNFVRLFFEIFKINNITLIKFKKDNIGKNAKGILVKKGYIIQGQNEDGEFLYGFDCYAEIISRVAMLAFLFPLFKLKNHKFIST